MRKIYFNIMMVVCGVLMMTGCAENLTQYDKGSDELSIAVTQYEKTLEESFGQNNGMSLKWTTGNNAGTGGRIYYNVQIAKAGTNFAKSYYAVFEEPQVYEWSSTIENLNNILLSDLNCPAGSAVNLDIRVTALGDIIPTQTAQTQVTITPYSPVGTTLYVIGDAVNGWDSPSYGVAMDKSATGVFTKTLSLSEGEFKFLLHNDSWLPSYNRGESDTQMVYRSQDSQADDKWKIAESGNYQLTANLLTNTLEIKKVSAEVPRFKEMYFTGDQSGWDFWDMSVDVIDPFLFHKGTYFTTYGQFKFATELGNWGKNFKATYANAPYTSTAMVFVEGYEPDNKWYLDPDKDKLGAYKTIVDIRNGKEQMTMWPYTPFDYIYLYGTATTGGTQLDQATQMEKEDDFKFKWTGHLNAGKLQFSCDKKDGVWFMPGVDGEKVTEAKDHMLFVDKNNTWYQAIYKDIQLESVDNSWIVPESGTYTIELNQLEETLTISKK